LNVDNRLNLQPRQIPFIAREIIEMHGTKISIEDVGICLKRGALGRYDDKLLRLDAAVILPWFDKYHEEKLAEIERQMYQERDEYKKLPPPPVADHETALEYIRKMQAIIAGIGQPVKPVKNIIREGSVMPPGKEDLQSRSFEPRPFTPAEHQHLAELKVLYGRECTDPFTGKVKEGKPTFNEWLKQQFPTDGKE
jgi:hypothetical protein